MDTIEEALGDLHSGDLVRQAKAALKVGRLGAAGTWAIPALVDAVGKQNVNAPNLSVIQCSTINCGLASLTRIAASAVRAGAEASAPDIMLAVDTVNRLSIAENPRVSKRAKFWLSMFSRLAKR
jgi:hypothetical protein